jgi:hypothetical protein
VISPPRGKERYKRGTGPSMNASDFYLEIGRESDCRNKIHFSDNATIRHWEKKCIHAMISCFFGEFLVQPTLPGFASFAAA